MTNLEQILDDLAEDAPWHKPLSRICWLFAEWVLLTFVGAVVCGFIIDVFEWCFMAFAHWDLAVMSFANHRHVITVSTFLSWIVMIGVKAAVDDTIRERRTTAAKSEATQNIYRGMNP